MCLHKIGLTFNETKSLSAILHDPTGTGNAFLANENALLYNRAGVGASLSTAAFFSHTQFMVALIFLPAVGQSKV